MNRCYHSRISNCRSFIEGAGTVCIENSSINNIRDSGISIKDGFLYLWFLNRRLFNQRLKNHIRIRTTWSFWN